MSAEKPANPDKSSNNHQQDILEAEAHGQEPPQSADGILSGRADEYDHSDQETEVPADERKGEDGG